MTADQLEAEFAPRAVRSFTAPGILMLAPSSALEFIERARRARLPVLGVDGFILDGDRTTSPLEHLADYSAGVARGLGCWDEAAAFITSREPLGLVFEVVLGDPMALSGREHG